MVQESVRSTGKSKYRASHLLQLSRERKLTWHQTYSFVGVQGTEHSGCNKTNYGMYRDFATEILYLVDQLSSTFLTRVEVLRLHLIIRGIPLNNIAVFCRKNEI